MNRLPGEGIAAIIARLQPGERIYVPGSAAEVPALTQALIADNAPPLAVTATMVPGINSYPKTPIRAGTTWDNPFVIVPAGGQQSGQFRHMPLSYGGFRRALAGMQFDTCIVHVAPPDASGQASLGPSVEFTPLAMQQARRTIAIVNPLLPPIPGSAHIRLENVDGVVDLETPLCGYAAGEAGEQARAIAGHIATFIEDGSTLQIGLGKVPDALLAVLRSRKGLRFHSGMLSDGFRHLVDAGAVDMSIPAVSCVHVGSADYYDWLRDRPGIEVRPVSVTHSASLLATLPRLVAINSALSVDLFGQANMEIAGERAVSGVGGAADFARGAALNPDGISIVGLPATGPGGKSRIVADPLTIVSLPRQDVDVVVTEFGAADLRGLGLRDRGQRLIEIAAPEHRGELADRFAAILSKI
jgi:acyl-CoA hydrolase